jgi:hypothetical protein
MMVVAVAVCGLLLAGRVGAENATHDKDSVKSSEKTLTTVKGKVLEIKNKQGKLLAVKIVTKGGNVHFVTLNSKGRELGLKMGGKMVEANGILTVKNKEKWLTVQEYKERVNPPPST